MNKLDELNEKVDILNKKVDQLKIFPQMVWGDNNLPPEVLKPIEIGDVIPNPYEIKCKGE